MRPPTAPKLMIGAEVKARPGLRMVISAACTPVTPESEETVWSLAPSALPSWSTALPLPEPTKRSAAAARRLLAPPARTRRPLATVEAPVKVLTPARVSAPVPDLVRPPALAPAAPPMGPAKVRSLVVTSIVPPAESRRTSREERSSAKPGRRRRVPPARRTMPELPPMLSRSEIARTPSLTVVPKVAPPAVFAPERTRVPRPDFVM